MFAPDGILARHNYESDDASRLGYHLYTEAFDDEPAKRRAAFLSNHCEAIAAMDFFTVPTLSLGVLYCFFVIAHDRRRILHCNVTKHPTSAWVIQQLREAFPYDTAPRYVILDRGSNFNEEVIDTVKSFGIEPKRTSFGSPWQNGIAERFVGSCRRDLLDHVIILNGRHLRRLMDEFIRYYHEDRTHLGLEKQTPASRNAAENIDGTCRVVSISRLGGLHHRYDLAARASGSVISFGVGDVRLTECARQPFVILSVLHSRPTDVI